MKSLVAAHDRNAGLIHYARTLSEDFSFKRVLVAWAKQASLQQDQFLRASYIEGALGVSPNAMVNRAVQVFSEARKAIESGDLSHDIARVLISDLKMSPEQALQMVSARDQGFWDACVAAAYSQMKPTGVVRGLSAEAIVNSLAFGLSPITSEWMKYGQGKGMMYWLGVNAFPGVTPRGVKSVAYLEVVRRTQDVVRGTSRAEKSSLSMSAPVGTEGEASIGDFLRDESLSTSLLGHEDTLEILKPFVSGLLRTPAQKAVWEIVADDPELLSLSPSGLGLKNRQVAQLLAQKLGKEYNGKPQDVVAAKIFREAVFPAIKEALQNSSVLEKITRNRDLMGVVVDEISRGHRRASTSNLRSAIIRLASQLPKGSPERIPLLRLAQEELKVDADPKSYDQNKPETYYDLSPRGVQGSRRLR